MNQKYQIIYADPPWHFRVWSEKAKKMPPYKCMSIEDIKSLPVNDISDENCVLFIWVVNTLLPEALEVIKAWGFEYKTKAFCWLKTTMKGLHWGLGYWTRANTEDCLLATKGNPKRIAKGVHQVIMSDVLDHSHKPAIVREKIVQLMGDLPRIELFARKKVEGWDVWGNEVISDIDIEGLK